MESDYPLISSPERQLQRCDSRGRRQVVGCIPYRYRSGRDELELLLVRSWNGPGMKFPKVHWGVDESLGDAAERVSFIKAGLMGHFDKWRDYLGKWNYLSKSKNTFNGGHMFAVLVPEQPELWSEEFIGQRIWVTVDEARNLCQHWWMNEALEVLVERCTSSGTHEEEIPLIARPNSASQLIVASPEIENSYNMDIEPDNGNIEHIAHDGTNGWSQKVSLEWIFVSTNFVLELPSVVLDQLSSAHKVQYKLFAMLLSFATIIICILELIYKGRKEKVIWRWRSRLPWFYIASQNYKPFGSFKDFVGSVCALCQCVVTAINYAQAESVSISFWPVIFAFGLLCSKMLDNPER